MNIENFSLLEVILWTVCGLLAGGIAGWQLRMTYDVRAAARKANERVSSLEDLIVNDITRYTNPPKKETHDGQQ